MLLVVIHSSSVGTWNEGDVRSAVCTATESAVVVSTLSFLADFRNGANEIILDTWHCKNDGSYLLDTIISDDADLS